MPLTSGTRLGPYRIESPIGAGGMGEVYRAKDTRLERTVAIKVLPPQLAGDPEFRERFAREAKSISALNHPNICTLYDIGEDPPGNHFLVLEHLEGDTLAARIAKGPLALHEALKIAVEVAGALDKAHRQGIVHRDLKPGNVMLTRTGAKLLDFGLAKSGTVVTAASAANSALTMAAPLTAQGLILGTFQYMAPEQIEGDQADPRTDIFAFGAVLYEMLTGQKAFAGKSQAGLLSAILKDEPSSVTQAQPMTPPALARAIKTCLEKNPNDRFQSAHDLWLQLKWIEEGGSAAGLPVPVIVHGKRRERVLWLAAALGLALAAVAATWWLKPVPLVSRVVGRFQHSLPEGQIFTRTGRHALAISPDGTKFAYVANQQLYLRAMDRLEAQPVPRPNNADPMEPVFSPDGQWLAYFVPANGAGAGTGIEPWILRKIAIAGGAPVTLAGLAGAPYGATWSNGTIAFGITAGIQSVSDSGGPVRTLVTVDPKKERVSQPHFTADGKHILFGLTTLQGTETEGQIVIQTLDGKDRRTLVNGGTDARVLPSGQLVYMHEGTLMGVPFDVKRLAVTGGAVPLVEGIAENPVTEAGQFAVSTNGTLAFSPGGFTPGNPGTLVWVDRQGREEAIPAKPGAYLYPQLSPDGTKIAVNSVDEEKDVWVFDLAKETLTRLTFGRAADAHPLWTPDSKYVLFRSGISWLSATPADIFRKAADGTGPVDALTRNLEGGFPLSISPDARSVVFRKSVGSAALFVLGLQPKAAAKALLGDPGFQILNAEISPDGRWIAYDSTESSRPEIYVRPFPAVDSGRWQVSAEGGTRPMWSRSGSELFFVSAANKLTAVPVARASGFAFGTAMTLFGTTGYTPPAANGRALDISLDGKRFLGIKPVPATIGARPSIVMVTNWFEEVKAKIPAQR